LNEGFAVIGDTVAMSTPHEIEYILTVYWGEGLQDNNTSNQVESNITETSNNTTDINSWIEANFTGKESYNLEYATQFSIDMYDEGYSVVKVQNTNYYLVVPDNKPVPDSVPDELKIINSNPKNIYVVGTASMDFFVASDSLDKVKFSSLKADDWYLDSVKNAMQSGSIIYAGKYSAPDFELLISKECDLVVENTMITHKPEIMLQLENLGLPVFIDYSSYEESVLGRMEWIKLYGLITNNLNEAESAFNTQKESIVGIQSSDNYSNEELDKPITVGFFAVTTAGTITIRKSNDYLVDIIELAGGTYGFDSVSGEEGSGTTTIQMEAFYEAALDCDYLIYNSTIQGEIETKEDLLNKCSLLSNCNAFKNDKIFCTRASFYQSVMELGDVTEDVNKMLGGEDDLTYFFRIQ